MSKHHEALNVLITVRRRVLDRLAETVTDNKSDLLRAAESSAGPFACLPDIQKQTDALCRLDSAIAAMHGLVRRAGGSPTAPTADNKSEGEPNSADGTFARFIELAGEQQMESAARELARVLRMPLDRMTTATRFFVRASHVNPDLVDQLADLPRRLRDASSAQAMSLLVRTFGFQAVETRMAVQAIRAAESPQTVAGVQHSAPSR